MDSVQAGRRGISIGVKSANAILDLLWMTYQYSLKYKSE